MYMQVKHKYIKSQEGNDKHGNEVHLNVHARVQEEPTIPVVKLYSMTSPESEQL